MLRAVCRVSSLQAIYYGCIAMSAVRARLRPLLSAVLRENLVSELGDGLQSAVSLASSHASSAECAHADRSLLHEAATAVRIRTVRFFPHEKWPSQTAAVLHGTQRSALRRIAETGSLHTCTSAAPSIGCSSSSHRCLSARSCSERVSSDREYHRSRSYSDAVDQPTQRCCSLHPKDSCGKLANLHRGRQAIAEDLQLSVAPLHELFR